MKVNSLNWFIFLFLFLHPLAANSQIYITWQGLEPDKLASLWLIKRFVDQEAEFKLVPKGSLIKGGIPFDVPSATFKRSHTQSTFECVLQNQGLDDERLLFLGKIIHDIEINTWEKKKIEQTAAVQDTLWKIIDQEQDENRAIHLACQYFDKLYEETVGESLQ